MEVVWQLGKSSEGQCEEGKGGETLKDAET
jgi:hypothetical protein